MKTGQLSLFDLPPNEGTTLTFKPLRHPVWTENKARLISRYLYYFILITKHGTYIDGFAGPQQAELHESWAARLVLEIEPRWLRSFFLCDRDPQKFQALLELKDKQPKGPTSID
jgi:three-Cys-motif partner protein